jgi:hypothetical protein
MTETSGAAKKSLVSLGVVTTIAGGVWIAAVQMTSTWLDRMESQEEEQRAECEAQVERWEGLYTACFDKLVQTSLARREHPPVMLRDDLPAIGDTQAPNYSAQFRDWIQRLTSFETTSTGTVEVEP